MPPDDKGPTKLQKLSKLLNEGSKMLIVMQDNPDPDSIAAAVALRKLVNTIAQISCSIAHGGTIGRGENRALVKYLQLNLHDCKEVDYTKYDLVALVDTQPDTGNNSLPKEVTPDIVIDHHPVKETSRREVPFTDIRSKYGSTATVMLEYLTEAEIKLDAPLATALLYAIRSDTQDLGREACKADVDAITVLFPLANLRMLSVIQRGSVPKAYFQMLAIALKNARVYGRAIVTNLGEINNPDMISELADLLLREDDTTWTLCMGIFSGKLLVSIRTKYEDANAGRLIGDVLNKIGTGGGHQTYAGGQVDLQDISKAETSRIEDLIVEKFLKLTDMYVQEPEKLVISMATNSAASV